MRLTKYGHACVFIEKVGKKLVIDPGEWTELPDDLSNIVAVVYTHMHGDHTFAPHLQKIVAANPDVQVFAEATSLAQVAEVNCTKTEISKDTDMQVGNFNVSLYYLDHAVVWQQSPCKNLAVLVDDFYYYPGDTFHVIDKQAYIAGVPVSAPWLKLTEAIQFVRDVKAQKIMPTHNGLLNDVGHELAHNVLKNFTSDAGKEIVPTINGQSLEA